MRGIPKPEPHRRVKARRLRQRAQRWKEARTAALKRDGWQCRRCGVTVFDDVHPVAPNRAHVNHINGRRGERLWQLSNLETLCHACHMPNGRHAPRT